jgi:hypothetical protein
MIEIQTRYYYQQDEAARQSSDSQGNSSGSGSMPNASLVMQSTSRTYAENHNATVNRTSFDKIGLDK